MFPEFGKAGLKLMKTVDRVRLGAHPISAAQSHFNFCVVARSVFRDETIPKLRGLSPSRLGDCFPGLSDQDRWAGPRKIIGAGKHRPSHLYLR
jgi:hypothetical protein